MAGIHDDRVLLRFRATWYCTSDLEPGWDLDDTGWHISVDGGAGNRDDGGPSARPAAIDVT